MLNITFTAEDISELASLMTQFLQRLSPRVSETVEPTPTPAQLTPAPAAPTTTTAAPTAVPNNATTPAVPTAPGVPAAPAAAASVPVTTAPVYTLDQIARAGTSLIDAGKMDALLELLARFGVSAVTQLRTEMYGAVATELRSLGAQI